MLIAFREKGRERERERERNMEVREKHVSLASWMHTDWEGIHKPGMCPDGNGNHKLLVYWTMLQLMSPTGQGPTFLL